MNKKAGYFVKINFKNYVGCSEKEFNLLGKEAPHNKYLLCGGAFNKNGGTVIFRADNEEEAFKIALTNPYIKCDSYNYQIVENNNISIVS